MDCKEYIEIILSIVLVVSNVILIMFNHKNTKIIKEISSPKPFLKPEGLVLDGLKSPVIPIKNYGMGHAVNLKVKVSLKELDMSNGAVVNENVWVEYSGDNVIPYIPDKNNIVDYRYKGNKTVNEGENLMVSIEYENDSGAKGIVVWRYTENERNKKEYKLIEGR